MHSYNIIDFYCIYSQGGYISQETEFIPSIKQREFSIKFC